MDTTETQKSTETQRLAVRAPLVPPAMAFIVGVLIGSRLSAAPWATLAVGVASAAAALVGRRRVRITAPTLALLWACAGMLRMHVWLAHPEHRLHALLPDEPQAVQLHAVVVNDPVGVFDPGEPGRAVCVLRLLHVRDQAGWPHHLPLGPKGRDRIAILRRTAEQQVVGWRPLAGRVRATFQGSDPKAGTRGVLSVGSDPLALAYGDEVLLDGEWVRVPSPGNPGEYDWASALSRERIRGLLRVRPFDGVVVLARGRGSPVLAAVIALRTRWERLIDSAFAPRDAGLLRSLLLGERGPLEERLKQAFVETGTVHLLAGQCTKLP